MGSNIKAGDLVGVGGAICVVPGECRICGRPATVFESIVAERPQNNSIDALCGECAATAAAEAAWVASLDPADALRLRELEDELTYVDAEAADPDEESEVLRRLTADTLGRLTAELAEFRSSRGAPTP